MHKLKWGPGALMHFAADTGNGNGQEPAAPVTPPVAPATPAVETEKQAGTIDDLPTWAQTLFKDLRKENAAHRNAKTEAERAKEAAEAAALAEQGKYKELYEKAQTDAQAAAERVRKMELDALRSTVGRKVGLPDALHGRLQGEDEAALEADAQSLLAGLTPVQGAAAQQAGTRFVAQHTGNGAQKQTTTKDVADSYISKTYKRST